MKELPLRPNVCILLSNQEGRLFLGERDGEPGHWQFPQGGVDSASSLEENVLRELEEELGTSRSHIKIIKQLRSKHAYDWPKPREYEGILYRGQSQTFWLAEFFGTDADIDLTASHHEFMNWRWASAPEVRTIASPVRLPSYHMPLREFEDYLLLRDTEFHKL